jgi:hypothetical protein
MTPEEIFKELEDRITDAQKELIKNPGRVKAGGQIAGLERAVFILNGLKKEMAGDS